MYDRIIAGLQVGATCVTPHPTQRHLVLAGGEDGSLTIWDLRENTTPATLLLAHCQAGMSQKLALKTTFFILNFNINFGN